MPEHAAVKVAVYWGDILYDTVLCEPSASVSIGKRPGNTFLLDLEGNRSVDSIELVKVVDASSAEVQFDDSIEGHVRFKNGLVTFAQAIKHNQAIRLPNGMYALTLHHSDTAELMIGHVSFFVDWTTREKPLPRTKIFSAKNLAGLAAFLLVAMPLAYLLQQSYRELQEDRKPPERLVQLIPRVPPETARVVPPPPAPAEAAIGEKKTPDGGAEKGELGKAELTPPKAPKITKQKIAKAPPRHAKSAAQSATSAVETIRNANLGSLVKGLASLGAAEAPAPTRGDDGYVAPIQQTGTGGFSTEGLKKGGGGKTVGIGRTIGQGEGGFEGTGRLGLSGSAIGAKGTGRGGGKAPAQAAGGLDREVIDNIVRQRKDRIRLCYERQLNFYPKLSGKITVHFEIDPRGNVLESHLAEDTMRNENVKSCVLSEVRSWTFPKPQGGVVVPVDYPFVFESSSLGRK